MNTLFFILIVAGCVVSAVVGVCLFIFIIVCTAIGFKTIMEEEDFTPYFFKKFKGESIYVEGETKYLLRVFSVFGWMYLDSFGDLKRSRVEAEQFASIEDLINFKNDFIQRNFSTKGFRV